MVYKLGSILPTHVNRTDREGTRIINTTVNLCAPSITSVPTHINILVRQKNQHLEKIFIISFYYSLGRPVCLLHFTTLSWDGYHVTRQNLSWSSQSPQVPSKRSSSSPRNPEDFLNSQIGPTFPFVWRPCSYPPYSLPSNKVPHTTSHVSLSPRSPLCPIRNLRHPYLVPSIPY